MHARWQVPYNKMVGTGESITQSGNALFIILGGNDTARPQPSMTFMAAMRSGMAFAVFFENNIRHIKGIRRLQCANNKPASLLH